MSTIEEESSGAKLIRNSIKTPDGTTLISRSRHDYHTYTDANGLEYMVDGGLNYLRRNLHFDHPYIETSLYTDEPHEVLRKEITWGVRSRGELGYMDKLEYVPIAHLSRAHITNIIADGYTGSYVDLMIKEINWRDEHETVSEAKRLEVQRENSYG